MLTIPAGVSEAFGTLLSGSPAVDWLLLGYSDSNTLKLAKSGSGGLDELADEFSAGKIQYAFARVNEPTSGLQKLVLIAWCGEGVMNKGFFNSHVGEIQQRFNGIHVHINARVDADVEADAIMRKVSDGAGTGYAAQSAPLSSLPTRPATKAAISDAPKHVFTAPGVPRVMLMQGVTLKEGICAKVVYGYKAQAGNEIDLILDSLVTDIQKVDVGWWKGVNARGDIGVFPASYVEENVDAEKPKREQRVEPKRDIAREALGNNSIHPSQETKHSFTTFKPVSTFESVKPVFTAPLPFSTFKAAVATAKPASYKPTSYSSNLFKGVDVINNAALASSSPSQPIENDVRPNYNPSTAFIAIQKPDFVLKPSLGSNSQPVKPDFVSGHTKYTPPAFAAPKPTFTAPPAINQLQEPQKTWSGFNPSTSFSGIDHTTSQPTNPVPSFSGLALDQASRKVDYDTRKQTQLNARMKFDSPASNTSTPISQSANTPIPAQPSQTHTHQSHSTPTMVDDTAIALFEYLAQDETEISVYEGEVITRVEQIDEGWWRGVNMRGEQGVFPANFVELKVAYCADSGRKKQDQIEADAREDTVREQKRQEDATREQTRLEDVKREQNRVEDVKRFEEEKRRMKEVDEKRREIESASKHVSQNKPTTGLKATVIYDYAPQETNELSLVEHDTIREIVQIDEGWWSGVNGRGEAGLFPANYVELVVGESGGGMPVVVQEQRGVSMAKNGSITAVAVYEYVAAEDNELSLVEGDRITEIMKIDEGWWSGMNARNQTGLFPANYVEEV